MCNLGAIHRAACVTPTFMVRLEVVTVGTTVFEYSPSILLNCELFFQPDQFLVTFTIHSQILSTIPAFPLNKYVDYSVSCTHVD